VTDGYGRKAPLMKAVFESVRCAVAHGIDTLGRGGLFSGLGTAQECVQHRRRGPLPIVTCATLQRQTPAWQNR
jgi:hypothetical protein